jgi:excisionase family DNA binding protein
MTPLAVSVPEAAALLGLSRSTAYAAVNRGEIPSVRIGGRVLVPLRKLEQLVDPEAGIERTVVATPDDEHGS